MKTYVSPTIHNYGHLSDLIQFIPPPGPLDLIRFRRRI
jgi:hypothetical protein